MDSDGDMDILSASYSGDKITWYEKTDYFVWDGSSGTDWNNANNWAGGELPTSFNSVIIPNVTNGPVINQDPASPAVCKNLTLQDGASLIINSGKALTIQGNLEVASTATLTVNSNAIITLE